MPRPVGMRPSNFAPESFSQPEPPESEERQRKMVRIYPYGIGQNRLRSAANTLNVPIQIVDNLNQAVWS